jgi:hypothetical protein
MLIYLDVLCYDIDSNFRRLQLSASGNDIQQGPNVLLRDHFHTGVDFGDVVVHHVFPGMERGAGENDYRYIFVSNPGREIGR